MAWGIFINYRRADSAPHAMSIAQSIGRSFGKRSVFMDVDQMRAGDRFAEKLEEHLGRCKVMLTIIGPNWSDARSEDGMRRLENPDDYVRLEIERALARGITIIPVLVDGADLPKTEHLPKSMIRLLEHHAVTISMDGFKNDMAGLVRDIRRIIGMSAYKILGLVIAICAMSVLAVLLYTRTIPPTATAPGPAPEIVKKVTSVSAPDIKQAPVVRVPATKPKPKERIVVASPKPSRPDIPDVVVPARPPIADPAPSCSCLSSTCSSTSAILARYSALVRKIRRTRHNAQPGSVETVNFLRENMAGLKCCCRKQVLRAIITNHGYNCETRLSARALFTRVTENKYTVSLPEGAKYLSACKRLDYFQ